MTPGLTSPYSCYHFSHSWQVWAGPLAEDSWVVVIVNRFDKEESITMDWHADANIPIGSYHVQDLWTGDMMVVKLIQMERNSGKILFFSFFILFFLAFLGS